MKLIIRWFVQAIAIYLVSYIVPGLQLRDFGTALVVVFVLALVNVLVKPLLVLLTLPFTILTLGLFLFVINAGMLLLVSAWVPGFMVNGLGTALMASILITIISTLLTSLISES